MFNIGDRVTVVKNPQPSFANWAGKSGIITGDGGMAAQGHMSQVLFDDEPQDPIYAASILDSDLVAFGSGSGAAGLSWKWLAGIGAVLVLIIVIGMAARKK